MGVHTHTCATHTTLTQTETHTRFLYGVMTLYTSRLESRDPGPTSCLMSRLRVGCTVHVTSRCSFLAVGRQVPRAQGRARGLPLGGLVRPLALQVARQDASSYSDFPHATLSTPSTILWHDGDSTNRVASNQGPCHSVTRQGQRVPIVACTAEPRGPMHGTGAGAQRCGTRKRSGPSFCGERARAKANFLTCSQVTCTCTQPLI